MAGWHWSQNGVLKQTFTLKSTSLNTLKCVFIFFISGSQYLFGQVPPSQFLISHMGKNDIAHPAPFSAPSLLGYDTRARSLQNQSYCTAQWGASWVCSGSHSRLPNPKMEVLGTQRSAKNRLLNDSRDWSVPHFKRSTVAIFVAGDRLFIYFFLEVKFHFKERK